MNVSDNNIEHLIVKSLMEVLSEAEEQRLEEWKKASPDHMTFYNKLMSDNDLVDSYRRYKAIQTGRAWKRFRRRVETSSRFRMVLRYAAFILSPLLLVGGLSMYLYMRTSAPDKGEVVCSDRSQATLVMENGETMVLTGDTLQQIPVGKSFIAKLEKGELTYVPKQEPVGDKDPVIPDNMLQTKVGQEFRITLTDGTQVHLNYHTSLKYPIVFDKRARVVYLKGEAYFDVAPDAERPFYVVTEGMSIKQYGTSFNVNAYSPHNVSVVLVKGSIGVAVKGSGTETVLKPGQRAFLCQGGTGVRIEKVNVEKFTSWNDGYFYFEDESLENIMYTLSYWYNVKVRFRSPELKELCFTGKLDRYGAINPILRAICRTVDVKMKIEEDEIIISK